MGNNQSVRSEKEMDCALTNYIENTVQNHLQFTESEGEVLAIKTAIGDLIDNVLREVKIIDRRFGILRKIMVGSMAEGTGIVRPDEFDFMIVLKNLSHQDAVTIKRDGDGFAHVELRDKDLWGTWSDMCENGNLRSTRSKSRIRQLINHWFWGQEELGLKEVFCMNVKTAVKNLWKYGYMDKFYGTLCIKNSNIEMHGSTVTLTALWYSFQVRASMVITVDLVAVIESDIGELVKLEDVFSPTIFEELQETGRVHLTPAGRISICRKGFCFQIACSETETRLINSLSLKHKICYKILKDMFLTRYAKTTYINMTPFLKAMILEHVHGCSENRTTAECLMELLKLLLQYYQRERISLFGGTLQLMLNKKAVHQLVNKVEQVRKEYPLKPLHSDVHQVRIKIQPKSL